MDQNVYNETLQRYNELQTSIESLENKIYKCKDEIALPLLRADYRELISKREAIYEQVIAGSHD